MTYEKEKIVLDSHVEWENNINETCAAKEAFHSLWWLLSSQDDKAFHISRMKQVISYEFTPKGKLMSKGKGSLLYKMWREAKDSAELNQKVNSIFSWWRQLRRQQTLQNKF